MIDWVQLIHITNELPLKNDIPRAFLVITWTKSTTPSPIITWVGVASKASIYMGIISTIWLMLNLSVRVPRPCLYMLGSPSKNLSIRVCNCLTPEICSWIQVHPIITWCLEATKHCRCILKEEHIFILISKWGIILQCYRKRQTSSIRC